MQLKQNNFVISIDPGITGTGLAIWDYPTKTIKHTEVITVPSRDNKISWEIRSELVLRQCWSVFESYRPQIIYCERPTYFATTEKGLKSAGDKAFEKLVFFTGSLWGLAITQNIMWNFIEIQDWKGQMSKEIVIARLDKKFPNNTFKTHVYDAVGIGLFALKLRF